MPDRRVSVFCATAHSRFRLLLLLLLAMLSPSGLRGQPAMPTAPPPPATVAEDDAPGTLFTALTAGAVYVDPALEEEVDVAALEAVARAGRIPGKIAVVAAPLTGEQRTRLAADLRERLNFHRGTIIVATPPLAGAPGGVSASSGALSADRIERTLRQANLDAARERGGLTAAIVAASDALADRADRERRARSTTTFGAFMLIVGGAGGLAGYAASRRRHALEVVRRPLQSLHRRALDDLSYVDGYLDVLPPGAAADRARELRRSAFDRYRIGGAILSTARREEDILKARPPLEQAVDSLEECRHAIDEATGGTGVAMSAPVLPSLQTDEEAAREYLLQPVEAVRSEAVREQMQEAAEAIPLHERGVSFFSGRPLPQNALVPVTLVVDGHRRVVPAAPDEAAAIKAGEMPPVRVFEQEGRQVPWYEYRDYDPYRDYYRDPNSGPMPFSSFLGIGVLAHVMGGGMLTGYSLDSEGAGAWGSATAEAADPQNAAGFDFFEDPMVVGTDDVDSGLGGGNGGGVDFGGFGD